MMMKFKELTDLIYLDQKLPNAQKRREILTSKMKELADEGKNCFSCNGMCCTSVFNSMQTTPVETLEVVAYLEQEGRLTEETLQKINDCIQSYRLDKDISIGRGKSFRRTYTCPFFEPGAKGCTLSLHEKPYGCLGFNAFEQNVSEEGKCGVYNEVHEERESLYAESEKEANEFLRKKLGLFWEKLPMPLAITKLIEVVGK